MHEGGCIKVMGKKEEAHWNVEQRIPLYLDSLFKGEVESTVSNFFDRKQHWDQLSRERALGTCLPPSTKGKVTESMLPTTQASTSLTIGWGIRVLSIKWAGAIGTWSPLSTKIRGPTKHKDPRGVVQQEEKVNTSFTWSFRDHQFLAKRDILEKLWFRVLQTTILHRKARSGNGHSRTIATTQSGAGHGIKPSSKTTITAGREWSCENRECSKKTLLRYPLPHKKGIPASTGMDSPAKTPATQLPRPFSRLLWPQGTRDSLHILSWFPRKMGNTTLSWT